MKKVAIVTKKMVTGGVERCLINMLKKYSTCCEVTLFLMSNGGELYDEIPSNVNIVVIPDLNISVKKRMLIYLSNGELFNLIKYLFTIVKIKQTDNFAEQCRLLSSTLPDIEQYFDIAISYHVPVSFTVVYTLNHIKAKMKYVWFHVDPKNMGINLYEMRKEHKQYDRIIGVSEYISKEVIEMEPENKEKVQTIYNCYDIKEINSKSKEVINIHNSDFTFVTVGRLCNQKQQFIIPKIASLLKNDSINFKWYLIGDGQDHNKIKSLITKYHVEEEVFIMGNKNNPYPYMKMCDIYIQTSNFEGFCTTTLEAKILGKVVITTDVSGAKEQFINRVNGLIVKNNSNDIYNAIKMLINDKNLYEFISNNVKTFKYKESDEYDKIFK